MLTTLLLVTSFALPPTGNLVHLSLEIEGWAGYDAVSYPHAVTLQTGLVSPSLTAVYGGGGVAASIYLRPVRDDDAPPPYQSFLQRTPVISLSVGGSGGTGFVVESPDLGSTVESRRRHWSGAGASIGGYPLPWLHLSAGLDIRDDYTAYDLAVSETLELTPWASAGLRFGDALLSVGYEAPLTTTHRQSEEGNDDTAFHLPYAGGVYFVGNFVIARRSEVDLSVTVVEHGARASGSLSVYFGRRFAFDLGIGGGSTRQTGAANALIDVDPSIGLTWWVISRAGARIGYQATWWDQNGTIEQEHVVTLSLRTRPY